MLVQRLSATLPVQRQSSVESTMGYTPKAYALGQDQVTFASNHKEGKKVYKFGTSGYRAIGSDFNDSVPVITKAIANYLIQNKPTDKPISVLIGADTRETTKSNILKVAGLLSMSGIDVYMTDKQIPTPILAYAAKNLKKLGFETDSDGAILLTASHNPWEYGGINFITPDGEIAPDNVSKQIESLQHVDLENNRAHLRTKVEDITQQAYNAYADHLETLIDFDRIKAAQISINYDAMMGAGISHVPVIFKEHNIPIHTSTAPNDRPANVLPNGPDPTAANLHDLIGKVKNDTNRLKIGLANDGDADRFGVVDENGNMLTPNDVIALALYHLGKNKGKTGTVVRSQATSHMLDELAKTKGLKVAQTPVGYKYVAEVFKHSNPPVLIGGESSGGLSIQGHIPEKDGILANLLMLELMAFEKKPIGQILKEVKAQLPNHYNFSELAITTEKKDDLGHYFEALANQGGKFANMEIDLETTKAKAAELKQEFGTTDGTKLYFKDGSWLLYRKSGTEPIGRIYFETVAPKEYEALNKRHKIRHAVDTLLSSAPYHICSKDIKQKL